MARLNMLKMIGLIVLLAISLALPEILPQADRSVEGAVQTPHTIINV